MRICKILLITGMTAALHAGQPEVRVDPRYELMSVVFRLAGFQEFCNEQNSDYAGAVDAYFKPYVGHPAVKAAKELRGQIGFSNIPNLAVLTKTDNTFQLSFPPKIIGKFLDKQWDPEKVSHFLGLMKDFSITSRSDIFLGSQSAFYSQLADSYRKAIAKQVDRDWLARTLGLKASDRIIICPAPLGGKNSYAAIAPKKGKGRDIYSFPAVKLSQMSRFDILIQELLHPLISPWVENHIKDLCKTGEALDAPVHRQMEIQAYGTPEIDLNESLVRAFTIRYFMDHGDAETANRLRQEYAINGFYWVSHLEASLDDFCANRDRFPTLESFSSHLVSAFIEWGHTAKKLAQESFESEAARFESDYSGGPILLGVEPPIGTQNLESGLQTMQFHFDRPMSKGMAVIARALAPKFQDKGTWSDEEKTLTFKVLLNPATNYIFSLNAPGIYGFKDSNGKPLRPTLLSFTTK